MTERVIAEAREAIVDGSVARAAQAEASEAPQGTPGARVGSRRAGRGGAVRLSTRHRARPRSPPSRRREVDELALGVELAALLGPDASRLLAAWREVAARASGLSPSESLALAERQLRGR